ncbi:MAG: putative sugar O-methyltransferase [Thalassobaculaceae bacterium]|nr:putative sugar O-methyltransferase [Thalassobaculaceae bacterium]
MRDPANPAAYESLLQSWWNGDRLAAARQGLRRHILAPNDPRGLANALSCLNVLDRASSIPNWIPRAPEAVPPAKRFDVDLPPLVDVYHRLLEETNRRRTEAWTPSSIEVSKFSIPLTVEHLANFRRSEVSSGTQTVPDCPIDFARLDFSTFYPDVTEADLKVWRPILSTTRGGLFRRLHKAVAEDPKNTPLSRTLNVADALILDDDRFGARVFDIPGIGTVTAKSLQSTYYACRLSGLVPENGSVLEVGGGFGAAASRLLRIRPDVVYMLTDLPVNLILTYAYLRSHFGEQVYGAFEGPIRPPEGCRVIVIPPWRLGEFKGRASVVFNSMSFQHMDARNHRFYGDVMRHFQARKLYHLNREVISPGDKTVHIPASRYSFNDQFKIVREMVFDDRWVETVAERKTDAG